VFFGAFPLTFCCCSSSQETPEVTGKEEQKEEAPKSLAASIQDGIASALGVGEESKSEKAKSRFSLANVDLLPKIKRGFMGEEAKEDAVVLGWKADVRSRKEREEVLRCVPLVSSHILSLSPLTNFSSSVIMSIVSNHSSTVSFTRWKKALTLLCGS
jgi:hypothetical protein